ncbi:NAD-dependent epimerase/dehydratase family protein [Microvirga pudoricolor]|uniref:NAD-dependent epimerase/dehydratase family protein n=1 Tax=Microvirga pudoricolor TaxID=2778729 RepID=UPI00194E0D2E|nr:NAD(P)-dependent oxidoreductase [Microvirga pudoricolor]MBM6595286.1 NAD(P)-dependent oxidoreductase [Microvirga pudoricolor]
MTTLVTGAGLIGCLTAEMLLASGEPVLLMDIRDEPPPHFDRKLSYARCDVTDRESVSDFVARHHVRQVVHTAAMLSTQARLRPFEAYQANTMGTACILEVARHHGLGRVVLASSTTVGYSTFETAGGPKVEEDFTLKVVSERPRSLYAASKLAGEHLGLLYSDLYGVDVVILRYGAVLGKGSNLPSSVPGRLLSILSEAGRNGTIADLSDPLYSWGGREEFVDARDCARANVCALSAAQPLHRIYNVATGQWYTLDQFVSAVRSIYPDLQVDLPSEIRTGFAGFPFLRPGPSDTSAATNELGFTSVYSFAETVAHCVT